MRKLVFGCVADDFTGASDAASFIARSGMKTMLFNGVPADVNDYPIDAGVIALKSRTDTRERAVSDSLTAVRWLLGQGAEHIYSKYCSTFDSTPEGNIGPVMDAILEYCNEKCSILCPALPVNGRTVKEGKLYVNGVLLEESSMKNHPLTPMRQSHIGRLMESQSKYPCIMIQEDLMRQPKEFIWSYIGREMEGRERSYLVPDYIKDEDTAKIVDVFGHMKVLSGGSGILTELCSRYKKGAQRRESVDSRAEGPGIIFAGSCSAATLAQIEVFFKVGHYALKIDPCRLKTGEETVNTIWEEVQKHRGQREILIYSSDKPEKVKEIQRRGKEETAACIENTFSALAVKARDAGYRRIIVAGGETSGAVTKALGYDSFYIGESIAPGVPVMIPSSDKKMRLILKSGNFGQSDFFLKALEKTAEEWKNG